MSPASQIIEAQQRRAGHSSHMECSVCGYMELQKHTNKAWMNMTQKPIKAETFALDSPFLYAWKNADMF